MLLFDIVQSLIEFPKGTLLFVVSFINISWLIYVVTRKPFASKKLVYGYATYAISTFVWVFTNAYFQSALLSVTGEKFALVMALASNMGGCFYMAAIFYISCLLKSKEEKISFIALLILVFISLENIFLNLYPGLTVLDVNIIDNHSFKLVQGPYATLFFISASFLLVPSLINLFLAVRNTSEIRNKRALYILSATMFTYTGTVICNIIFPMAFNDYQFVWIPPILSLIEISILGYAILTDRFRSLSFLFIKFARRLVAFFISVLVTYLFYSFLRIDLSIRSNFYWDIIFIFISIFSYLIIYRLLNKYVFRFITNRVGIENFCNAIWDFKNKSKHYYHSTSAFQKEIHALFTKRLNIDLAKLIVINKQNKNKYKELINFYKNNNSGNHSKIIVTKEIRFLEESKIEKLSFLAELEELGEICLPLFHPSKSIIGFLILGKKPLDSIYLKEEIDAIENLGHYLGLVLTGILYNQELKKEVEEKTREIKESNKKLRKLDKAKDMFLSIASHELRTPMTIMRGYSELLLSQEFGKLNEQQKDFSMRIFKGTNDLILLVNNILDVSKLEADKMDFYFLETDFGEFIRETVSNFEFLCRENDIILKLHLSKDIKSITTDPDKLKLVLNNLIGNAYKFTPKGGKIDITVREHRDDPDFIYLAVKDTGPGIPRDKQKEIFDRFQQVGHHLKKGQKGTGLGLSIVKRVTRRLRGKIWVESKEGQGSKFVFLIPKTQKAKASNIKL